MKLFALLSTLWGLTFSSASPGCIVFTSTGQPAKGLNDPLFNLLKLESTCPSNVMEFREILKQEGAKFVSTMVNNRSFHNPNAGSFSFFEMVEIDHPLHLPLPAVRNELFFGHFTAATPDNSLTLDQNPRSQSLMIELIAWDKKKQVYNFYELIGSTQGSQWFYRGDSADIWADTAKLHRTRSANEPVFGTKLRCSGCHIAGGPIMKELTAPQDSWWTAERPLILGKLEPDASVAKVLDSIQPASALAKEVQSGTAKLFAGKAFQAKLKQSPQIALRPLFCAEELNLSSAPTPLDDSGSLSAPSDFFVDTRLGATADIKTSTPLYLEALKSVKSQFPETRRPDGDHGWLAPVKGHADILAIQKLIVNRTINKEFVADVLAVDMTRPVFSPKRCQLLQLLPNQWSHTWENQFKHNLQTSNTPAAKELLEHFTNTGKTIQFHQKRAKNFITHCQQQMRTKEGVTDLVHYLGQVRSEVSASEISKNLRGQILEPGFRVIFPTFTPSPAAGQKVLDDQCV